eukprot:2325196-Rhodomonas_salina.2
MIAFSPRHGCHTRRELQPLQLLPRVCIQQFPCSFGTPAVKHTCTIAPHKQLKHDQRHGESFQGCFEQISPLCGYARVRAINDGVCEGRRRRSCRDERDNTSGEREKRSGIHKLRGMHQETHLTPVRPCQWQNEYGPGHKSLGEIQNMVACGGLHVHKL